MLTHTDFIQRIADHLGIPYEKAERVTLDTVVEIRIIMPLSKCRDVVTVEGEAVPETLRTGQLAAG